MQNRRSNPEFMNGVPELLVLRLLEHGEQYGYELVRAIRQATDGEISLGEGVVYPALHALERDRCLTSRQQSVQGRDRVYYRLTRKGRRRLQQRTNDWCRIVHAIQLVLGGDADAQPTI